MGKGGGGTNTVEQSSAPPADVMAQYDNLIAQANTASAAPLQQYSGNIVAPFNDAQNQAFTEVQNAQGASQPLYNQAQGLIQQASRPITPQTVNAADIQQYQNPYTQQVINSTMANIQQQDAGQQSQLAGNAVSAGAFGGDRQAVAQALLANQQDLANNQTIAGLENQSYSQALGEANTQQQAGLSAQEASQYLGQQGGTGLTNLGNTEQSAALTGASALTSVGGLQQQLQQEQLNVPYEQFQQQQAYPYQNLSWLSGVSTGLGSGLGGTTSTTSPAASLTSQLGGLGLTGLGIAGASGAFSPAASGAARGGRIEGLIKKLNTGGAVVMPPHYDGGGIIPGNMTVQEMENAAIPDLSQNSRFSSPQMSKGIGIPSMMKPTGSNSTTTGGGSDGVGGSAGADIAAAKGLKGLFGGSGSSESLASNAGTSFDVANAQAAGLGNEVAGFQNANGTTNTAGLVNASGDSIQPGVTTDAASPGFWGSLSNSLGLTTDASLGDAATIPVTSAGALPWLSDTGASAALSGAEGATGVASGEALTADAAPAAMTAAADAGIFDTIGSAVTDALPYLAALLFNKGGSVPSKGLVRHYDGGGLVPSDTSTNPTTNDLSSQYANMSTQQLQQILPRIQQPQAKQIVQKVLQQKQMMPNTGNVSNIAPSAPSAPQATMARGGLIKKYADGGGDDTDYLTQLTSGNTASAPDDAPSAGLIKADPIIAPMQQANTPSNANGFTPVPIPTFHDDQPINKVDPWLSVAAAGAGMMASKSPHALEALGQGAQEGLSNYGQQKKEAADETYKSGSIQDARDQMVREVQQYNATNQKQADQFNQSMTLDQQKADQAAKYQAGELARQNQMLALQQQEAKKPIFDKSGNPWQLDSTTNTYVPVAKGQLGVGQNSYGYDIGTIPTGSTAPVLDPKYDPTLNMPPVQKAISDRNMQTQLEKDNTAANVNNDSIARLQASKNVITTAPTGGITNLFGIGSVADAYSTQRQELGALNKELAMAPGERPTNMRLTQGEVMMLKQAQPGNDKSPEANSDIADANIAIRTRPAEFANFKNDFIANNGYWNDAIGQQMYNKYAQDNPIIDVAKSGQGKIALNPNRQTIEQYANNGGFSKWGVRGSPQTDNSSGSNAASALLPMPSSKADMIAGKTYNTVKGPATWDGSQFNLVSP